ncbi:MAG: hypothetical protein ACI4R8_02810 [Candidatus Caccovivens sp.]
MKKTGRKNITEFQKRQIQQLLEQGYDKKNIAANVGIEYSTIYKELKRGWLNGKYNAEYSIQKSLKTNKNKGNSPKFIINKDLAELISNLILQEHMTIIQIKEKCKKEGIECPSRTTIYRSIDEGLIPNITRESLHSKTTTMFSNGLIQIPKYIREKLNLKDKDKFTLELNGEKITISKLKE